MQYLPGIRMYIKFVTTFIKNMHAGYIFLKTWRAAVPPKSSLIILSHLQWTTLLFTLYLQI